MNTKTLATLILLGCGSFAIAQTNEMPGAVKNAPAEPPSMKAPPQAVPPMGGTIIQPRVYFESPKDGETVSSEFTAKLVVTGGPKTAKAGASIPGQGHHHIIVDSASIPKGELIPISDKHIHLLEGQTEAKLKLPKGEHTLTVQFGDGTHHSYGEAMSQTIRIKVK